MSYLLTSDNAELTAGPRNLKFDECFPVAVLSMKGISKIQHLTRK